MAACDAAFARIFVMASPAGGADSASGASGAGRGATVLQQEVLRAAAARRAAQDRVRAVQMQLIQPGAPPDMIALALAVLQVRE